MSLPILRRPILALQGAPNDAIQALLLASARRWQGAGLRVAGIVERPDPEGARHRLEDLATGARYDIYRELGPGSDACKLCGSGIVAACQSVQRQILAGCDLVVLSKFGKLEAARSGLVAAFAAAIAAERPILTAVAPIFAEAWRLFSDPLSAVAGPSEAAIEAWRAALETAEQDTPPAP
ncbi:DUF2478 domain-containing protein [Methylobacterium organophilum]|uniref:DUF2478 domain-containing protein n=1 Tax=Methylobacterium organophilum TaxID=410 RepID=A0ABQ4T6W9_METOR|nr:DUF2478 domain-containing protein [Methylobacterium organophilum]GJE27387.1 hypothetical protein LKMONMHP_2246 [Methylobacterium organophilum]